MGITKVHRPAEFNGSRHREMERSIGCRHVGIWHANVIGTSPPPSSSPFTPCRLQTLDGDEKRGGGWRGVYVWRGVSGGRASHHKPGTGYRAEAAGPS